MELNRVQENLTFESIDKTDHGLYVCQASNEHTTTNITTLIIVESEFLSCAYQKFDFLFIRYNTTSTT